MDGSGLPTPSEPGEVLSAARARVSSTTSQQPGLTKIIVQDGSGLPSIENITVTPQHSAVRELHATTPIYSSPGGLPETPLSNTRFSRTHLHDATLSSSLSMDNIIDDSLETSIYLACSVFAPGSRQDIRGKSPVQVKRTLYVGE